MSKKSPVRMTKKERFDAATAVAIKLAQKVGAVRVSIAAVAAKTGVSGPLLFHVFGSREGLTAAIVKGAKKAGVLLPPPKPTKKEVRETTSKKAAARKRPAPKKVAALLKPPVKPGTVKVNGKSIKAPKGVDGVKLNAKLLLPGATGRKPRTPAQKQARAARDAAATPKTSKEKFEALPTPFAASIAAVAP